jgi:4-methylaminobutanoate oxidase (formaldehyde-forming)
VRIDDVTSRYGCLAVWGPEARGILAPLTTADLSDAAFAYLSAQEISVGPVPCLAQRVTFVGELGFELYCPTEYTVALWDLICEEGAPAGLLPGGYRAIESLRLEKGYRVWGSDVTAADTPMEAGLEFAVRMQKGEFVGRAALAAAGPPTRRLACLVLDDPRLVVLGSEPVRVGGRAVGRVTSGGYGYTVERSIAYAYLPAADAVAGRRVELDLFGTIVGATVALSPLYDPANERVRS